MRPEPLAVDRRARGVGRRPGAPREGVEVALEAGPEHLGAVRVREGAAAGDPAGERLLPGRGGGQPVGEVVERAVRHVGMKASVRCHCSGCVQRKAARPAAYGQEVVEVLHRLGRRDHGDEHPRHQKPRSRPISIFMISLEPAQILLTRASRQARATRYSFM